MIRIQDAVPYFIAIGLMSPFCINSWNDLEKTRKTMICFGGIVLLAACFGKRLDTYGYRSLMLAQEAYAKGGHKMVSSNPLAIASFGGSVATFAFLYFFTAKNMMFKFISIVALGAAAIAMVNSGSRGNIIAVSVSLLLGLFLLRKQLTTNDQIRAGLLLVIVVAVGVWHISSDERMARRWNGYKTNEAVQGRAFLAGELFNEYAKTPERWFLGLGSTASFPLVGFYCHVTQVEILCELGVIGILLYGTICILTFQNSVRLVKNARGSPKNYSLAIALVCCSLTGFITQAKSGTFIGITEWFALSIVISSMARATAPKKKSHIHPMFLQRPQHSHFASDRNPIS
ncbi:hypothetical protein OAG71_02855 [bacterium]|nr:hypothetical protein [bacterium]